MFLVGVTDPLLEVTADFDSAGDMLPLEAEKGQSEGC